MIEPSLHPDLCFKACSDRTRLRILFLLQQRGELCVCDLMAVLQVPQAKMSRHLAYLRKAGLVSDRRQGQWVHYRLKPPRRAADRRFYETLMAGIAHSAGLITELKRDQQRLNAAATGVALGAAQRDPKGASESVPGCVPERVPGCVPERVPGCVPGCC